MRNFITYHTPPAYSKQFDEYSNLLNLKNANVISALIFGVSVLARILYTVSVKDLTKLKAFEELNINNYAQIVCSLVFFLLTYVAINSRKMSLSQKKILVIAFICYLLTAAYVLSHIISRHNTKNTLVALLMGIFMAGLFFSIKKKEANFTLAYFLLIYFLGIIFSNITLPEKLGNGISSLLLSIVLYCSSRYCYFIKSNQFVQIRQLEEKNHEISILNNEKNEIMAFVAHDLRGPLNNIDALSQMILLDDQHQKEALLINKASNHAKTIINDIIDVAKIGSSKLNLQRLDLNDILQNIANKWNADASRNIAFAVQKPNSFIHCDPSKIERVIDNLISNAVKFSQKEKPIDIVLNIDEKMALIMIKDYGIGIPLDMQNYLFDQFSKAGRLGLMGEKSTGLGLHISYKVIEQHQGKLFVDSKENEGTTFTIQLPLASA
ncbi:Sensor protein kinase WalK [compost metagenome]